MTATKIPICSKPKTACVCVCVFSGSHQFLFMGDLSKF